MIPDYLIYDELKRRRDDDSRPRKPLERPLYSPDFEEREHEEEEPSEEEESNRGVVIIDMNDGIPLSS